MEWRNLLIQLFVPTSEDGQSGRIGTGYPVARDLILTAAHVVGDCDGSKVEACWWHSAEEADRKFVHCEGIAWDGRQHKIEPFDASTPCDVVLLRCTFPESAAGKFGTVSAMRPQDHGEFASSGFAFDGDRGETPIDFVGYTTGMGNRSPFFAADSIAWREKPDDWKGASGAPIIVGNTIIGVIVSVPQKFNASRLNAVPLFRLLAQDQAEFRNLLNYSTAKDHQRQLMDAAVGELKKSSEATHALAGALDLKVSENSESTCSCLVETLMDEGQGLGRPVEIAAKIVKAQASLDSNDQGSARACLHDTAMLLIPASLSTDRIHELRLVSTSQNDSFQFRGRSSVFVELGMARLHGRNAKFKPVLKPSERPEGLFQIEWPPDPEKDTDGTKLKANFVRGLFDALDCPKEDEDEQVVAINDELLNREAVGRALYYCVFRLNTNEEERRRQQKIAGDLDTLIPKFSFIGLEPELLSPDERSVERRTDSFVTDLILQAAGIELK